jgi:hypothetical protein
MRPDTGQNSKNRDFVIQREFNIMTQRAMILLHWVILIAVAPLKFKNYRVNRLHPDPYP